MQCDHGRDLISAYIDGELTGAARQAVALQIKTCPACASHAEDLHRMGRQIAAAGREPLPAGLAARIRMELAGAGADVPVPVPIPVASKGWNFRPSAWTAGAARMAAALLVACVLSSALTAMALSWQNQQTHIETEIVAAHIRSLLQDSPIQVASSDSHTVRPWFAGRIDFAPDVNDFATQGFDLIGGRLDYVGERRVGAIVYKRRLHTINVFMWPAPGAETVAATRRAYKGYNSLTWQKNGITYWAVSDLNANELQQLQALL